jgi:hypothetical protein
MTGAADGQPFGDSLDDAQDNGFQQFDNFHGSTPSKKNTPTSYHRLDGLHRKKGKKQYYIFVRKNPGDSDVPRILISACFTVASSR